MMLHKSFVSDGNEERLYKVILENLQGLKNEENIITLREF